jgi:hypothetical protein
MQRVSKERERERRAMLKEREVGSLSVAAWRRY